MVGLAGDMPDGAGVTIDFEAALELGQPLVVLLTAAPRARFPLDSLTSRERDVTAFIAAGLSNRAIAARS